MKKKLQFLTIGLLFGFLSIVNAHADAITKPHTFSPGTVAKSSEVNANFDTVYDQVNKMGSIITVDDINVRVGINIADPDNTLSVGGIIESTTGGIKFPDGTTQVTAAFGDGYSLDAADGSPTDAVYVDSAGNVGIGTGNPTELLQLKDLLYFDVDGDPIIRAGTGHALKLETTNGVFYMKSSSGNVGIGTITPSAALEVAGTMKISGSIIGNVGIGTSNPTELLQLKDLLYFDMDGDPVIRAGTGHALKLETTNGIFYMTASTGNVGIGTASPVEKLSVNGTVESKTGGFKFPDGTTQTSAAPANSGWHHSATTVASDILAPWDWTDLDLSSYVGQNHALVTLKFRIKEGGTGGQSWFAVRTNGDTDEYSFDPAASSVNLSAPAFNQSCVLMVETDSNGIIEWKAQGQMSDIILIGYVN